MEIRNDQGEPTTLINVGSGMTIDLSYRSEGLAVVWHCRCFFAMTAVNDLRCSIAVSIRDWSPKASEVVPCVARFLAYLWYQVIIESTSQHPLGTSSIDAIESAARLQVVPSNYLGTVNCRLAWTEYSLSNANGSEHHLLPTSHLRCPQRDKTMRHRR